MNILINEQLALFIILGNYYYSGAYTTLSIQVMKRPIKLLSSQRPRENAVSSFIANTSI